MSKGNRLLFTETVFSPDIYFNGLQFRLLTWRFTYEILRDKRAWLFGVSPGNAQHELNHMYQEKKMYLGENGKDGGFWNFNCHNVYLQTLLESGILGLIFLLASIFYLVKMALKERQQITLIFFGVLLLFGLTESVLSSQYTILLFVFFPLLNLKMLNDNTISWQFTGGRLVFTNTAKQ